MYKKIPEGVVNAACEAAWPEFRSHLEGQQAWSDADPLRQNRLRLIVIQALTAVQQQRQPVRDGTIDANNNAEYIEHCADVLERRGLRVTADALRVIAHEHRTLSQQHADERVDVRKLEALAEQWERYAAGCLPYGFIKEAELLGYCAQCIRQTLGISASESSFILPGRDPLVQELRSIVIKDKEKERASARAEQPDTHGGVGAPGSREWMAEVCRAAALSLAAHGVWNDQLLKVADWIAQQPAQQDGGEDPPPDMSEWVEWLMELADEYDAKGHHDRAYDLRNLAQQGGEVT